MRSPFKVGGGCVNAGTHMSVLRTGIASFIVVDCVELNATAKEELDALTQGGDSIVAVLNTHPYHTLYVDRFHTMYPSIPTRRWYGTPRHILKFVVDSVGNPITWFGSLNDACVRRTFEPDIFMQIPAGAEFVNPQPANRNHFSNVVIFHSPSKTLHTDDLMMYYERPGLLRAIGVRSCTLMFHFSLMNCGLHRTPEAPREFYAWATAILDSWDFENIATAHNGVCYKNAKVCRPKVLVRKPAHFV